MTHIALAGFQHETNSFGVGGAGLHEFEMADSWPGLLSGRAVISGTKGMNLPVAGFISEARNDPRVSLHPILWCAAEPSGPVTDRAFETIAGRIVDGIASMGQIDGVYLDLHGAMITESTTDGEGELLARVRNVVGDRVPIVASLDLHANVTRRMVETADGLCVFRTYPHLDMAETGARAFAHLMMMMGGARPARAFRQVPYLVPLHAQHTGAEPARTLYAGLTHHEDAPGQWAELALGFTGGDTFDTGASVIAHAASQAAAEAIADEIFDSVLAAERCFDTDLLSPEVAVTQAMLLPGTGPVVIADVQDNPGAGASSDTTGLLSALVSQRAQGAIFGLMCDPDVASLAHAAGRGALIEVELGGKSAMGDQRPFGGRFRVETIDDGNLVYSGKMYGGGVATLGATAVLRLLDRGADVQIVVNSIRNQCLDRAQFTHFGLEPAQASIVCVKSTAHFRADFEPIAKEVLLAAAPGAFPAALDQIAFRNLRSGIRLGPASSRLSR